MNRLQIARQIRYLLELRKWDDNASNDVIFGKVVVSSLSARDLISRLGIRDPFAIVRPGAETNDSEFPEIVLEMAIEVEVVLNVRNDPYSEAEHIGGVRTDLTKSRGRGVLEVLAEVKNELSRLDSENGIDFLSQVTRAARSMTVNDRNYAAAAAVFRARGTIDAFYHPARALSNSGSTITWTLPPDRWDRNRVVLRYASGATPPASVTAGSGATLSADLATTYTHGDDGQPSGEFSYSLFSQYDPVGAGTTTQFQTSASATLTATF